MMDDTTRTRAEHILKTGTVSEPTEIIASVSIVTGSTPPLLLNVIDNKRDGMPRGHLNGYLSFEAAELLRRALNDILGPFQDERDRRHKDDRLRSLLNELAGR